MRSGKIKRAAAVAAVVALVGSLLPPSAGSQEEAPEGVQMLLGRNGIPAIFEPVFVSAPDATIPDDAWVLGVVVDGQAHAYSLNLLNHHEIVNDNIGGRPLAAVW